jgi:hypothetical protein
MLFLSDKVEVKKLWETLKYIHVFIGSEIENMYWKIFYSSWRRGGVVVIVSVTGTKDRAFESRHAFLDEKLLYDRLRGQ